MAFRETGAPGAGVGGGHRDVGGARRSTDFRRRTGIAPPRERCGSHGLAVDALVSGRSLSPPRPFPIPGAPPLDPGIWGRALPRGGTAYRRSGKERIPGPGAGAKRQPRARDQAPAPKPGTKRQPEVRGGAPAPKPGTKHQPEAKGQALAPKPGTKRQPRVRGGAPVPESGAKRQPEAKGQAPAPKPGTKRQPRVRGGAPVPESGAKRQPEAKGQAPAPEPGTQRQPEVRGGAPVSGAGAGPQVREGAGRGAARRRRHDPPASPETACGTPSVEGDQPDGQPRTEQPDGLGPGDPLP